MNWDEVYAEHHAALLRRTAARCGNLQAAADIVADVWAKAWQRRESYNPARGSVEAWLNAICRSTIADHYRAQRVKHTALQGEPAAPTESETPDLARAIDALPAHYAAAVRAVYLDDRSFPEAAKAMGCSVGATHKWCVAGVKRLRQMLAA
jgi:RNA polymerase sigma-70 factor, ECF subfamily